MPELFTVESGNLNILTLAETPDEAASKLIEYFMKNQDYLYLGRIITIKKGEKSWLSTTESQVNNYRKKQIGIM